MKAMVRSSVPGEIFIESSIGLIAGVWRESSPSPQVGQWVSVELNIDYVIHAADVVDSENRTAFFVWELSGNRILGFLESVDDDGMGYLRLAVDCLVMMETTGGLASEQWVQIQVPSSSVGIFGGVVM